MKKLKINRSAAYKGKNGVYVFYINFNFIFFKGDAAAYIKDIFAKEEFSPKDIPVAFIDYLLEKKLFELEEAKNGA